MQAILIFTNFPDRESAMKLGQHLITEKLAACVNVLADCTSIYPWEGKIESAREVPVLIKTRAECYQRVERAIKQVHPYELPEIIAVPIVEVLPDYLNWVFDQTHSSGL